jgi:uncharacterized protein
MFLSRLILLLVILGAAWYLWRRFGPLLRRLLSGEAGKPAADTQAVVMLRCEHCGLHIASDEAVRDGQHVYCSEAHRLAAGKSTE